jgi:hypothetical protein
VTNDRPRVLGCRAAAEEDEGGGESEKGQGGGLGDGRVAHEHIRSAIFNLE